MNQKASFFNKSASYIEITEFAVNRMKASFLRWLEVWKKTIFFFTLPPPWFILLSLSSAGFHSFSSQHPFPTGISISYYGFQMNQWPVRPLTGLQWLKSVLLCRASAISRVLKVTSADLMFVDDDISSVCNNSRKETYSSRYISFTFNIHMLNSCYKH